MGWAAAGKANRLSRLVLAVAAAMLAAALMPAVSSADEARIAVEGDGGGCKAVCIADGEGGIVKEALDWEWAIECDGERADDVQGHVRWLRGQLSDAGEWARVQSVIDHVNGESVIDIPPSGEGCPVEEGWYIVWGAATAPSVAYVDGLLEIHSKSVAPTISKEVHDGAAWKAQAVFGEGEAIPYRVTATVPEGFAAFGSYHMAFHDEWHESLELDRGSVRVTLDGEDVTARCEIAAGARSMTATLGDIVSLGARDGSQVVLSYSMSLAGNPPCGKDGLYNTAYATYSLHGGEPESRTVEVSANVATLRIRVVKHGSDGTPLEGAAFTLEDGDGYVGASGSTVEDPSGATYTSDSRGMVAGMPSVGNGTYRVTETKAPEGYLLPASTVTTLEIGFTGTAGGYVLDAKASGLGEVISASAEDGTVTVEVVDEPEGANPPGKPDAGKPSGAAPAGKGAARASKGPLTGDRKAIAIAMALAIALAAAGAAGAARARRAIR